MPDNSTVALSENDLSGLDKLLDRFQIKQDAPVRSILIPLLQALQEHLGWLPPEALEKVSQRYRIPLSNIYGVVTFYSQFYLEPRGKHTVRVCRGTACHVRGAAAVMAAIEETLGIGDGETTPDMQFTLETVACLGACALAPVILIDETYHGKMTASSARELLNNFSQVESGGDTRETTT